MQTENSSISSVSEPLGTVEVGGGETRITHSAMTGPLFVSDGEDKLRFLAGVGLFRIFLGMVSSDPSLEGDTRVGYSCAPLPPGVPRLARPVGSHTVQQ